ncbi:hypothetical protein [Streptomyces sp. NPDC059712]|uniref:hypothetical protein n=1 Tax=Streptomyces sp. NPDC059712 TaxID=3346919 RepID=UPI00368F8517
MSEWNLSVRLTGQGSNLSRTLRSLSGDARTASRNVNALRRDIDQLRADTRNPIRVRLDVDAGHLRSDVRAALASAGSGQGLRVRLGLDADHLRSDVTAALSAAGAGQGLSVNLRLGNAMQLRREVEDAVRWAAWGHRIDIPIGIADPMQLRRDVSAAVRWASMNQTIRVRVDPDTSRLRIPLPGLPGLPGGGGGGGGSGLELPLGGLLPIATAAIPLIAGLAANLAPLAGMFAAAGGGAAAFGIALAGQVGALGDIADAEKKYEEAVRDHGAASKEAVDAQIAYQKQLADLPPETQRAAVALSTLKQTFGDWSDDMAAFTMAPVEKSFTLLEQLIPRLSPEVESFSGQMDRLLNIAGGAITTPGFDALSDRVATLTDAKLDDFTDSVIHLLRVVSEGDADEGVIGSIIDYMRENGPAAREALDAIGDAIGTLLEAGSAAGPIMLTLVTAVANLVAALPPQAVAIFLQAAAALKLLTLAGAGFATLAGRFGAVRTAILGLAAASTAAGGGLRGLRAAFMALGTATKASIIVAGIALAAVAIGKLMDIGKEAPPNVDKLTTSLKELGATGKVTGEAARAFGDDLDGLYDKVRSLTDPSTADDVQQFITTLGGIGDWDSTPVKEAKENLNAIDEALANLVKGGQADLAAEALKKLTAEYGKGGRDTSQFTKELDDYQSAIKDAQFEQQLAAQSMGLFGSAAQDTTSKLAAQKQSADGLRQAITALNDVNRAAGSAMNAFEQSIDDASKAVKDHQSALKLRDGELDLGSQKARDAEKVLSDLAANTEAAATAAREQGKSWEDVNGIYDKGRDAFIKTADAMGLTSKQAEILADSYLALPDSKTTRVEMQTEDAIAGLDSVIAAIQATPNRKAVTVDALTAEAIALLQNLGFTVERLPDGRFSVTADTATAKQRLADVQNARDGLKNKTITISAIDAASKAAQAAKAAIDKVRSKQVTITARYQTIGIEGSYARTEAKMQGRATGAVVDYYADGGMRENHVAQIAPAGQYRVWAEQETGGESYIPLAPSKRGRSRRITEETVRRLGGDPASIDWYASGGISNWQYDPISGSLYSPSDAGRAGHKTKKVKGKDVDYFDLGAVEKKLWKLGEATVAWNRNLEKVADRAGGDVARALASMGEDGMKLAEKMAKGTDKYVASMSIALRRMMQEARAQLSDFTEQLSHATGNNKIFQDNLTMLAAMGYGDLASQLAAQGDQAAMELAAEAASSPSKAKKANEKVKQAKAQLTSDQMAMLIEIIAALTNKNVGIHQVAEKTGLGEDDIIEVGNKAKLKLMQLLGGKASRFLSDLVKANRGQAYENGGIRAGLYATQGGIVRFAEPSTKGEAYIPLGQNKRGSATRVLSDVATRFGLGLTDGQAGRVVIIREQGPLVGESHVHIADRQSDRDLAREIESRQGYQLRRLARGGVAARGNS